MLYMYMILTDGFYLASFGLHRASEVKQAASIWP